MSLPEEHLKNVCRLGQGKATCSFLAMGGAGFECQKGTSIEKVIRERLAASTMGAKGDNCSGPPHFQSFSEGGFPFKIVNY